MLEAMLETYQFKGASVSMQAMLVLYAQGLLTGVSFVDFLIYVTTLVL